MFSGQLRSSLHCSVCSHYSTTFDVFCDLSLPLPQKGSGSGVTLRDCLDLFSQEEKLDKENSPVSIGELNKRGVFITHSYTGSSGQTAVGYIRTVQYSVLKVGSGYSSGVLEVVPGVPSKMC